MPLTVSAVALTQPPFGPAQGRAGRGLLIAATVIGALALVVSVVLGEIVDRGRAGTLPHGVAPTFFPPLVWVEASLLLWWGWLVVLLA